MAQTLDNLSYTWNNAGTTFTGIKYNVTDTASASGSLLMDLQVGGVSTFSVVKNGQIKVVSGSSTLPVLLGLDWLTFGGGSAQISTVAIRPNQFHLSGGTLLGWGTTTATGGSDLFVGRDAPNTFAQRNGVNAQTSRIYGTYTDASNNRRLALSMSTAGVAEIKPEGAGTGASGNVLHISGLPTSNPGAGILWNDNGTVKVGT